MPTWAARGAGSGEAGSAVRRASPSPGGTRPGMLQAYRESFQIEGLALLVVGAGGGPHTSPACLKTLSSRRAPQAAGFRAVSVMRSGWQNRHEALFSNAP